MGSKDAAPDVKEMRRRFIDLAARYGLRHDTPPPQTKSLWRRHTKGTGASRAKANKRAEVIAPALTLQIYCYIVLLLNC